MNITVEDHLKAYREQHGEDAWRAEVRRLALAALRTHSDKVVAFWKALTKDYDWLEWAELEVQAESTGEAPSADRLVAEALKRQMPGIRSQAQYDAVVGAMEAVQLVVNALLERDAVGESDARKVLEKALEAVAKATEVTMKLADVPEAASSDASKAFKASPAQFLESDVQAELLQELAIISTRKALDVWYDETRGKREQIVDRELRNQLLDSIRAKYRTFL